MSDYPLIDPADVRAGDVVRGTCSYSGHLATFQGPVWIDPDGERYVGGHRVHYMTDLRLVHRPAPPEPALRVGDFVHCTHYSGMTGQIVGIDGKGWHSVHNGEGGWGASGPEVLTRIEPPVGWPVAVPDRDEPGGVRWYYRPPITESYYYENDGPGEWLSWPDLVAAGGVPALAPEPTP